MAMALVKHEPRYRFIYKNMDLPIEKRHSNKKTNNWDNGLLRNKFYG